MSRCRRRRHHRRRRSSRRGAAAAAAAAAASAFRRCRPGRSGDGDGGGVGVLLGPRLVLGPAGPASPIRERRKGGEGGTEGGTVGAWEGRFGLRRAASVEGPAEGRLHAPSGWCWPAAAAPERRQLC